MTSVLLDTSFCIHLVNQASTKHENAWCYFDHFIENKITMYLSTIVISEYSVKDDPKNLPLESFRLINFDYLDGIMAGKFMAQIYKKMPKEVSEDRNVVKNDINLLAQAFARGIDAVIARDANMRTKYIPAIDDFDRDPIQFIDLAVPCEVFFNKQLKLNLGGKP